MKKQKLFYKIYLSFLILLIPFAIVITIFFTINFRDFFYSGTKDELIRFTLAISDDIAGSVFLPDKIAGEIAMDRSRHYSDISGFRITIVTTNGTVIGDSSENPGSMENHAGRPEIREAAAGRIGYNIRYSNTLNENLFYVARPLYRNTMPVGVLRAAVSIASLDNILALLWIRVGTGSLIALGLSGILALWVSRRISSPLEQLTRGTEEYRRGNLDHQIKPSRIAELDLLSIAMNSMASDLKERINTIMHQQSIENAIFSTMVEGIIALDTARNIILINRAAGNILEIDIANACSRRYEEIIHHHICLEFISRAHASESTIDEVLRIYDRGESWYNAYGIPLIDENNSRFGTLIVIHDITKLKRLEKIRKDFAANVSHEFKTPLTVIRGYVETLLSLQRDEIGDISKFLSIIAKETERLTAIVDDLMSLARIEQDRDALEIIFTQGNLKDICMTSIAGLGEKAIKKGIKIALDCPDNLCGMMNSGLLIQALVNLIDNAVKYSEENGMVQVSVKSVNNEIAISVKDTGCGIPAEHHERIFERFYRVDKARDRKTGGTGLGLALVKHIALVHSGRIEVESAPDAGSVFTLYIKQYASI